MTIQAIAWVLDESEAEGVDRLVLIAIANHANEEWVAWPSQRTIAREARVARNTVAAAIRRLVDSGEVELVERGTPRRSARYRMTRTPARPRGSDMSHPLALSGSPAAHQRLSQSEPPAAHQRLSQSEPEPKTLNREPGGARLIPRGESASLARRARALLRVVDPVEDEDDPEELPA